MRKNSILTRAFGLGLISLLFLALVPAGRARAGAVLVVDSPDDGVDASLGDGVCAAASGLCTLRAAIQEANALAGADTILLPSGTYSLTLTGADEDAAARGDLDITSSLVISATGLTRPVIAGLQDRVFHITGTVTTSLSGLAIQGGFSSGFGGGILVSSAMSHVTLEHSVVISNHADYGGGIRNAGVMTIAASTIGGNVASVSGGGISNTGTMTVLDSYVRNNGGFHTNGSGIYNRGTLTVLRSTVDYNASTSTTVLGGGIYNEYGGTFILIDGLIADNLAGGHGGGIWNAGTLSMTNTTVTRNQAPFGGGGLANGGDATVDSSTISLNRGGGISTRGLLTLVNTTLSGNSGGGLYSDGGSVFLNNVTLVDNEGGVAGGVYAAGGSVSITNSLIGRNRASAAPPTPSDCSGSLTLLAYSLLENPGDCTPTGTGPGNLIGLPPLVGPLDDHGGATFTHPLLPGSPAMDAGNPAICPAADQRGVPRPAHGGCDMGAYEYDKPIYRNVLPFVWRTP